MSIWDLAKPVIAQVHGYCLAGGSELATACDLVYVAEDAQIGYPPVRLMSPPDMQFHPWLIGMRNAMEMMLTGDSISGIEAAEQGFAAAQLNLGALYQNGDGVPQDYVQAYLWYTLALAAFPPGADHDRADRNRAQVAGRMPPDEISRAQQLAAGWRPKAAE